MQLKWLVLIAVIFSGLYTTVLNIVRFRSANNPTPESVSDVYDAETYSKWKKYSAEHSILNIVADIIACLVTLALLITNVFSIFASLFPQTLFMQLFAVILLEVAVSTVLGCIFSYISTMKI